jgi:hypothetical protein
MWQSSTGPNNRFSVQHIVVHLYIASLQITMLSQGNSMNECTLQGPSNFHAAMTALSHSQRQQFNCRAEP